MTPAESLAFFCIRNVIIGVFAFWRENALEFI